MKARSRYFNNPVSGTFKHTEVGLIPSDWLCSKLGSIAGTITTGKLDANAMRHDGDYPFFTCARKVYRIDTFAFDADALLVSGNGNVGYIHHYTGKFNAYQRTYVLKDFSVETIYLKQQLERGIQDRICTEVNAGNMPYILKGTLSGMSISVPPTLAEQQAIAEALSDAGALIEGLEKLIAKKRLIKQGAMQELLTGKHRLPGVEGKWEIRRLGKITFLRKNRVDPSRSCSHEFCVELEHIGQGTGRLNGFTSTSAESSIKTIFKCGDVLFGKLRAYLRKYWATDRSGICSTEIWAFVAYDDLLSSKFLFQILTTDNFIDVASTAYGTHMPRSDWNVVQNFEVQLPQIAEQEAITSILSDMDADVTALEAKLSKARQIKQGMMQELLTGRIRLV